MTSQQPHPVVLFQDEIAQDFRAVLIEGPHSFNRFIGLRAGGGPVVARDQAELRLGLSDGAAVIAEHGGKFKECYLLVVECACGQAYRYPTLGDIPAESVTCACGRPIIQYTGATP